MMNTLISIYGNYLERRSYLVDGFWYSLYSYVRRICAPKSEFERLLRSEEGFRPNMSDWLAGHFATYNVTADQAVDWIIELKLFKEELEGRKVLLLLMGLFFASLIVMFGALIEAKTAKSSLDVGFVAMPLIFSVLAIFERANIVKHQSCSSQLIVLLEDWCNPTIRKAR